MASLLKSGILPEDKGAKSDKDGTQVVGTKIASLLKSGILPEDKGAKSDKDGTQVALLGDSSVEKEEPHSLNQMGKLLASMLGLGGPSVPVIIPIDKDCLSGSVAVPPVIPVDTESASGPGSVPVIPPEDKNCPVLPNVTENMDCLSSENVPASGKDSSSRPVPDNLPVDKASSVVPIPANVPVNEDILSANVQVDKACSPGPVPVNSSNGCTVRSFDKHFEPLFHHPLCHDHHQYLGVPIIPGFGILVYHIPLDEPQNVATGP